MQSLRATPALLAISLSIPVSVWWFASLSLAAPLPGPFLIPVSLQVLTTYVGLQVTCIALFAPLWITSNCNLSEHRSDVSGCAVDIISFLVLTFPLVVMLGLATGVSFASLATIQFIIFALGYGVAFVARFAGMRVVNPDNQRLLVTAIGVIGAACFWNLHVAGLQWVLA